jgi:hypothetical protein
MFIWLRADNYSTFSLDIKPPHKYWISNGLREFWEGRALRNCPVGNFSEGDSLQG